MSMRGSGSGGNDGGGGSGSDIAWQRDCMPACSIFMCDGQDRVSQTSLDVAVQALSSSIDDLRVTLPNLAVRTGH